MISLRIFESTMPSNHRIDKIESAIYLIRGHRVMLDSDLAAIYAVSTRQLNQQLKRNRDRFPEDFAFQLTKEVFARLTSQIVTSKKGRSAATWQRPQRRDLVSNHPKFIGALGPLPLF